MKLLILFLIIGANAQNSCDMYCSCESGIVTCFNSPVFPTFYSRGWITTIILIGSSTHDLPVSEVDFPNLNMLVLRNTPNIQCNDLFNLHTNWPELDIDSDLACDTTTSTTTTVQPTPTTTASPDTTSSQASTTTPTNGKTNHTVMIITIIIVILVVILIAVIILFKMCKVCTKRRSQPTLVLDDIDTEMMAIGYSNPATSYV